MSKICRENGGHDTKLFHVQPFDYKIGQDAIYHCKNCDFKAREEYSEFDYVFKTLFFEREEK